MAPLPVVTLGAALHEYLDQARENDRGDERYYTEEGRAPSGWRTSTGLEIDGPVTARQFVRLLDGEDPVTGADRLDERSARRRLAGWSGVLAAPPEVTLLIHHGVGHLLPDGRDVGVVARACWEEAVDEALSGLEGRLGTRAGAAGAVRLDAVGWQMAVFRHETNRDGWLHTHTHYVLPNCVQGADGVWRTVDSRRLVPMQKVIGAELQAAVRRRFGADLGVVYDHDRAKDGIVPAVGLDPRYVEARSSRRRAIGRYLAEHRDDLAERGVTGRRAELYAERATRAPKDTTVSIDDLRARERRRLEDLGLDVDRLVGEVVARSVERTVEPEPVKEALFERLAGPEGVTKHQAVFAERDVLVECLAAAPTAAEARVWAGEFLAGWALPARSPSGEAGECWYTTVSLVAAQDRARQAWTTLDGDRPLVSERAAQFGLEALADRGIVPSGAQHAAIGAACSATGPVIIEGPPGCGKTSVVAAAVVAAARADRVRVVGAALALEAASLLGSDTGLPDSQVHTLAGLLARSAAAGPGWFANTLVVIDEASMLGTRQAAELFSRIAGDGGRLVLLGDGQQAPPVEAGGVWAALCEQTARDGHGSFVRLVDACRQVDPAERETVALLRAGHVGDALTHWDRQGRVVGGASDDQVLAGLAGTVADQLATGQDVLVLAATRDDAERAGLAIRHRLLHRGALDGDHRLYGTVPLAVGDRVVLRANDRRLGARNGTRGTIDHLDERGVTVRTAGGRSLTLPAAYVAENVEWAYAVTVHTGQGQAADHVHVLANPALYRELAVVAGSRHRHTVTWHLCAGAAEHLRGPHPRPTVSDLAAWASRPRAEAFAHPDPERPLTLAELHTARDHAKTTLASQAQRERAADVARRDHDRLRHQLDQLQDRAGDLERERRTVAAKIIRLPTRPVRRRSRDALHRAERALHGLDRRLEAIRTDSSQLQPGLDRAQQHRRATRALIDAHRPEVAAAQRHLLRAELGIATRTSDLGRQALDHPPDHLLALLGPAPAGGTERRKTWADKAGRLQAYLERWNLQPDALAQPPHRRSPAHDDWRESVAPFTHPHVARGIEQQAMDVAP